MIPDRDYYTDKDGKLTTDPAQAAVQIAVKGCFLDPRIAMRFGIGDTLVSVDEPNAPRRVSGRNASSVHIDRIDDKVETKTEESTTGPAAEEPETEQPSSGASAVEPTAEKSKAPAKKAAAQKGAKKAQ